MTKLSPGERDAMIATAEDSFNDICKILDATSQAQNSFGEVVDSFTELPDIECGFSYINGTYETKNERGQIVILEADAILRVNLNQDVSARSLVICRGKRFTVGGILDGRTVRIVTLKEFATSEEVAP